MCSTAPLPHAHTPASNMGGSSSPVPRRFTSAFEVANKSTELLMLRGGISCSCGDPGAIARYEAALAAEQQQ